MATMRMAGLTFFFAWAGYVSGQPLACPSVRFQSAPELNVTDTLGQTETQFVLQRDGSYSAVNVNVSQFTFGQTIPNAQQQVAACVAGRTAGGGPPAHAPTAGTGSRTVVTANFTGNGFTGTAYAAPGSNEITVVLQTGSATLLAKNYPVGSIVISLLAADFNGDNQPDLAVATSAGVVILMNGAGSFQRSATVPMNHPVSLAAADFTGDGLLDLAVVGGASAILPGNGNGTFQAAIPFAAGTTPLAVTAADFNRDGFVDIAVATGDSPPQLMILPGNGQGGFRTAMAMALPGAPGYVAAADFNKDGKLDLAVAATAQNAVYVFPGNGDGSFGAMAGYAVSPSPSSLVIADFDGDGNPDVAVASGSAALLRPDPPSGDITILFGTGDGTFYGAPVTPLPPSPTSLALGDLNGDGFPDLVAAYDSGNYSLLTGSGAGRFSQVSTAALPGGGSHSPSAAALADFNGDGKPDAAFASESGGGVLVMLNNGNATFGAPALYPTGAGATAVVSGDFNGDGKIDLATVNPLAEGGGQRVSVLLGNGGGGFQSAANFAAGVTPVHLSAADFNGDGKLDLAVADKGTSASMSAGGGIDILLGNGDGTFQTRVVYGAGFNPQFVAVGDLNGDGKLDLAAVTTNQSASPEIAVLLGRGDGTFQLPVFYPTATGPVSVGLADLNGDGKRDLIVAHCCTGTEMSYLLGDGAGGFGKEAPFAGGGGPASFAVADWNHERKPGLAILGRAGTLTVLVNRSGAGNPAALAVVSNASFQANAPLAPASIAAGFAADLATGTAQASTLTTTLLGTTVAVTDSLGAVRPAYLFYVSPGQIDFEIPPGTALGPATVTATAGDGVVSIAAVRIAAVAPGLFPLNQQALAAAQILRVANTGARTIENVYQLDASRRLVPLPIVFGNSGDRLYLILYGTGIRGRSGLSGVAATVGASAPPVFFAGAQGQFEGEDQVNIGPLPADRLAGAGSVNVTLTVDGQQTNAVNLTFQ